MAETAADQTQVVHEGLAAATLASESDHEAVCGPHTELEASMAQLRELQQQLYSKYAHQAFGYYSLSTAVQSVFVGETTGYEVVCRKLQLGNGVVYETLSPEACADAPYARYRVILTAELTATAAAAAAKTQAEQAAAAAEKQAQRDVVKQKAAAKEESLLQTIKQFADVPEHGADLNGARESVKERRRIELRVSDRTMKICPSEAFDKLPLEGLGYEHYVQPVKDSSEAYLRLVLKFLHPVKKSPSQLFKMLGNALDLIILPERKAAAARAKAKAEAEREFQKRVPGVTLRQCLQRKYFRIKTAYAYAVPEDGTFYDLAEGLEEQEGEFRTEHDRDMAMRKSLTTDANGKDLTQKAWKDRVVELTSTITELESTIESLLSDNKRQKVELKSLSELKDWELQEDGAMIKVDRTDERMLEEQAAADAEADEYRWYDYL